MCTYIYPLYDHHYFNQSHKKSSITQTKWYFSPMQLQVESECNKSKMATFVCRLSVNLRARR